MATVPLSPVRVEGQLDPGLSRWLWLVKWLLAIPHFVVLAFLWIAFVVLSVVSFFAILFTGRYPRALFDFNVGVRRWTWRVAFYSYSALGTDRYPPFTLGEAPDYPAQLTVAYPERLSRGLVLVKSWLLAIPHYVVVAFFLGGVGLVAWHEPWGGLIAVLVLIAAVALLFTGRYPRGIFDFVLGLNRWALRVAAYAALMTDAYPPFRLDLGGTEPGTVDVDEPRSVSPRRSGWTGGGIALVVTGSVIALLSLGLLVGGTGAVVIDQVQRDSDGFVMTPTEGFSTGTYALVSETADVSVDGPDWVAESLLGTVRIRSESDRPLFVGIARERDVDAYLGNVRHAVVTDLDSDDERYDLNRGGRPAAPPATQDFWAASSSGSGERTLDWDTEDGNWKVVAMNADGSPGVDADLSIGAELDALGAIGAVLLAVGVGLLGLAALLIFLGVPRAPIRTDEGGTS